METDRPTQSRRERQRQATRGEILDVARRQIAEMGAAALSLRAIARAMGLTAPAIYRYFGSRDELVTALIVDSYTSLAEALEGVRIAQDGREYAGRLLELMLAYRAWALAHPQDYALIFGTPIPGYAPPAGATEEAGSRALRVLVAEITAAIAVGALRPPLVYAAPEPELAQQLAAWRERFGVSVPAVALQLGLVCWARAHGLTSLELYGQVGRLLGDGAALYRAEALVLLGQLGLAPRE